MPTDHRFVRAAAAQISRAADATCAALAEGLIRSSRVFTDRLLRRAAKEVDKYASHDLRWRAQVFLDEESVASDGSEMIGVLEVDLPDYSVRKAFLATSLLVRDERLPAGEDLETLRRACRAMLATTAASYAFLYLPRGVIVVPASAVVGSSGRPDRLHRRQLGRFYEEHFSCFIGDSRLTGEGRPPLEELARRHGARAGLALAVEPAAAPRQETLFRR